MSDMNLQRLVLDRLSELDLSYRTAAARSRGMVSHTTIYKIATGKQDPRGLEDQTITGLALALGVSEPEVRRAIGFTNVQPPTEFKLPAKANHLTPKERKAILSMIDAFIASREQDVANGTHR